MYISLTKSQQEIVYGTHVFVHVSASEINLLKNKITG